MHQNIVGESFHEAAFKALAAEYGHRTVPDYGVELPDACAAIVCDPDNPFDSNAVAVWIDGRHLVGHLPRDAAAQYAPCLDGLDRGTYLEVPARVWIGHSYDWDERTGNQTKGLRGSVSVRLPETHGVVPYNDLPDTPYTVLPWGRAVQITGEEHHMDALRNFALGSDPRHVAATLHVTEEPRRSGDPVRVIEVRLDGEPVGTMSKATSQQIHDLVTYVASCGRVPVARAIVKGSDLRADVVVHVARTSEVPQKWLDSVKAR
ncbi:MAG TPA: HIRAN domain-containing protein [Nocardioides sp.]|uniref:HIRAN domain-containing protein n=1 Tax=Nocardioides sp. TaxID=35761 RepID=UPI002F3F696D